MLHRKTFKRFTAALLALVMACPSSITTIAQEKETVEVAGTRMNEEEVPEGKNIVYFGAATLNVTEKEKTYTVPIYRSGSEEYLAEGEEILLHTQDFSALYGSDYRLLGDNIEEFEHKKTLLEMLPESSEEDEENTHHYQVKKATDSDAMEVTEPEEWEEPEYSEEEEEIFYSSSEAEGTTVEGLAALKQEQTGNPTRETGSSDLPTTAMAAIMSKLAPELLAGITYSAQQKLNFQPGETETYVSIHIINDGRSEGTEMFSVLIAEAEKADPYGTVSLSVRIEDDEEAEYSVLSFESSSFTGKNGSATVRFVRTGALYSMATAKLKGKVTTVDSVTEEETTEEAVFGEVTFLPYEESKEAVITLYGNAELELYDLTAAKEGELMTASVVYEEEIPEEEEDSPEAGGESEEGEELLGVTRGADYEIKIDGKKYTVKSDKNAAYGRIMDTTYDPALEVGLYLFPAPTNQNGWFAYNKFEGYKTKHRSSQYEESTNRGILYWYNGITRRTGKSITEVEGYYPELCAAYYQYAVPHWSQSKSWGGGSRSSFWLYTANQVIGAKNRDGKFDPLVDTANAVQIKGSSDYLKVKFAAVDDQKNKIPEIRTFVHGTALMYKRFEIKVENPVDQTYLSGNGTISAAPFQIRVECGAQTWSSNETRNIYANPDSKGTKLVFSLLENTVNGNKGKFAVLTGYTITIGSGDNSVTVSYPKDYTDWLRSKQGTGDRKEGLPFTQAIVEQEIKVVEENLDEIHYDAYFLTWIESVQKGTAKTSEGVSVAYYQKLRFKPTCKLKDCKVTVLAPLGTGSGTPKAYFTSNKLTSGQSGQTGQTGQTAEQKFRYKPASDKSRTYEQSQLINFRDKFFNNTNTLIIPNAGSGSNSAAQSGSSTEFIFHAGDKLDLTAAVSKEFQNEYEVVGYEYSTNGSIFDLKRSDYTLVLSSENNYWIRPVVCRKVRGIEIEWAEGTKGKLSLENDLVPLKDLAAYPDLKGKYFLDLNPKAESVYDRIKAEPGKEYSISVLVEEPTETMKQNGTVFRPVITDLQTNKQYNGQRYDMIARTDAEDNKIRIGYEVIKEEELKTYTLKGSLVMSVKSTVDDGLGFHKIPASKYSVTLGNMQYSVKDKKTGSTVNKVKEFNAVIGENSSAFELKEIKAKKGDRITLCCTGGISDGQVKEIVLPTDGGVVELGELALNYPILAPVVSSISYKYSKSANNQKQDLARNSIHMYDDELNITASIRRNGHQIEELLVVILSTTNVETGRFNVKAERADQDVFQIKIPSPLKHNYCGDKIYISIVEKKEADFSTEDTQKKEAFLVQYPRVPTGYVLFVENELVRPKNFELPVDPSTLTTETNIPQIGTAYGKLESGKLDFTKLEWENGTGFTISAGFSAEKKTTGAYSTEDKKDRLAQYQDNARKVVEGKAAEARRKAGGMDANEAEENGDAIDDGVQAKSEMTKNALWECNVKLCLAIDFVLNPKKQQYECCRWTVTVGGTGWVGKTWYTVIYGVPAYLNLKGEGEASLTLGAIVDTAAKSVTSGDFDSNEGNIKDILSERGALYQVDIGGSAKVAVGVGVCGILGARGYVQLGIQFQLLNDHVNQSHAGFALFGGGGIAVDLLVMSCEFPIYNGKVGVGSLKGQTKSKWLPKLLGEGQEDALSDEGEGELTFTEYTSGADVSNFGQVEKFAEEVLGGQPERISREVLLTPAATRTRPQLIDLDHGNKLLIFLGSRGGDQESSVLYYALRDEAGKWSTPQAVNDNGAKQTQSSALKVGNKVYLAWVEGGEDYEKAKTNAEKLDSTECRLTCLEIKEDGTIGEEERKVIDITTLPYMVSGVQLSETDGRLFCSYLLTDYQKAEKDEDILDMSSNYTAPAVTEVNTETLEVVPYEKGGKKYNERYIEYLNSIGSNDPLVLDSQTAAVTIGEKDTKTQLLVTAYTAGNTNNLQDGDKKELYLKFEDITSGSIRSYYPIRLTYNDVAEACPTLTKLNGELYLSWVENGYNFRLMNVAALLEAMFAPGYPDDKELEQTFGITGEQLNQSIRNKFMDAGTKEVFWYSRTAEELGMPEELYEGSIYDQLFLDNFKIAGSNLAMSEEVTHNISNHKLVSDGNDIYVFYTDVSNDPESSGVELFGLYCSMGDIETEEEKEEALTAGEIFLSDSVQISDDGQAMDEISIVMNDKHEISIASNFFSQSIGEGGKMNFGENSLVYSEYVPRSSVEITEEGVQLPGTLVPGTYESISFDVVNNGMLPATGYRAIVTQEKDGKETPIWDRKIACWLKANEVQTVAVPWLIPENAEGSTIKVQVEELNVEISEMDEATAEIPSGSILALSPDDVFLEEDGLVYVWTTVTNLGNKASNATDVSLYFVDNSDDNSTDNEDKLIASGTVPSLEAGESMELEMSFEPAADQFTYYGQMTLVTKLTQGDKSLAECYQSFNANKPLLAEINDGEAVLIISPNSTKKLDVAVAPWDELAGDLVYGSSDSSVAAVSEDGTVTAKQDGLALLYVYDPVNHLYDDILVQVGGSEEDDGSSSGTALDLPAWVERNGSWTQATDGKWQYELNGKVQKDSWLCIYNPYADTKKNQKIYAWFRFDKDGFMLTGWFDDKKDGNRYYLNPVSDGTKGSMISGWKQIDGKWYYFSKEEGSGHFGALLRNTITPDGYKVGSDGAWIK